MNEIEDRVCFVTGGATGIGYEMVLQLLSNEAAKVYIGDWNEEKGRIAEINLTKDCKQKKVQFISMDVTNINQFEDAFKKIIALSGRVDILINNAGVFENDRTLDINIKGVYNGLELGMKYISKRGKIINISSTWAFNGIGEIPKYVASSHAIIGLSRSYSACFWHKKHDISVLALCVGPTTSDFTNNMKNNVELLSQREQDVLKFYSQFTPQSTSIVASNLIRVLNYGENGQIWISESCEPLYEIDIPNFKTWKLRHNYMF